MYKSLSVSSTPHGTPQAPDADGAAVSVGSKRKRKGKDGGDGKPRKRFVWPEALHRDFVTAIFDVGLKCTSPSKIQEAMPEDHALSDAVVHALLAKFRIFRQQSRAPASAAALGGGGAAPKSGASDAPRAEQGDSRLWKKLEILSETLTQHSSFVALLRSTLQREEDLQHELLQRITHAGVRVEHRAPGREGGAAVSPAAAAGGSMSNISSAPLSAGERLSDRISLAAHTASALEAADTDPLAALGAARGSAPFTRPMAGAAAENVKLERLGSDTLTAEMASHMSMHREMLTRRDAQISQYEAAAAAFAPLPGANVAAGGPIPPAHSAQGLQLAPAEESAALWRQRNNSLDDLALAPNFDDWDNPPDELDSQLLFNFLLDEPDAA